MINKLQEIYNGWKNYAFPSEKVEELAKTRVKLCVECDKLKKNNTCGICGCFMLAKTKLKHMSCPKGFWGRNKKIK